MKKSTGTIDKEIGSRVRMRRVSIGMSQEKLGDMLGLTFQQVQKYEKGMNRISVARLVDIAKILNVEIDFFFDGIRSVKSDQGPQEHCSARECARFPRRDRAFVIKNTFA
jgi:transcriptional regulator with XRE-family HTH domain